MLNILQPNTFPKIVVALSQQEINGILGSFYKSLPLEHKNIKNRKFQFQKDVRSRYRIKEILDLISVNTKPYSRAKKKNETGWGYAIFSGNISILHFDLFRKTLFSIT